MWQEIWQTLAAEFSDLSLSSALQLAIRLTVAGLLGALLGWEREVAGKAAGLRTHILVSIGAAGFVAVPLQADFASSDVSRVLQGLITGIGFLGAGCILKANDEGQVKGLTTAAGIWLTAGVGVAAGLGRELSAILLGVFGWFTLSFLLRLERKISSPPTRKQR